MKSDAKAKAIAYYTAFGKKNIEGMGEYLHPDVEFTDPMETVKGKEAVLKAAKGFTAVFKSLTIRTQFGSDDQAMLVLDIEFPALSKKLLSASLLNFQEGLISKIELFYDSQFANK